MFIQNLATVVAERLRARPKLLWIPIVALALLALDGRAWAQAPTIAWNSDRVSWAAPAACTDGSPLADCPITGYRLETALTPTATTWTLVTITAGNVTSHLLTGLTPGPHCYRVIAQSGAAPNIKQGPASNVECQTASGPAPGRPSLGVIDTVAYDVRFDFRKFRYVLNKPVGAVPLDTVCRRDFQLQGDFYRVERKDVAFDRRNNSAVIVARCS